MRKIADVVVVGAGPAGAHAAAIIARGGLNVILVDRRERGKAGAQWLNDVPRWMLDEAGLRCPEASRHRHTQGTPFLTFPPKGDRPVRVEKAPGAEVDMRALGRELADEVEEATTGSVLWGVTIDRVELDRKGRPIALIGQRKGSLNGSGDLEKVRLEAALFIDASGLAAVVRKGVPALASTCPVPEAKDMCAAAQEVRVIADPDAADRWLAQHNAKPGDFVSRVGVAGGFSVLRVMVEPDRSKVSLLTGAIALPQYRSGRKILNQFVGEQPWIGACEFGGSRAIPLRRPYTHLVSPGIALLGDAACQVYAAHGSGIGIGLNAARLLGSTVVQAARVGLDLGSITALWAYPSRFHQRWGGLLCGADIFRRLSQRLSAEETERLIASGLMSPGMVYDSLAQRHPRVHPNGLMDQIIAAVKAPDVLASILPTLVRMPLLEMAAALYYPDLYNPRLLDLYEVLIQMIAGEDTD